LASPSADRDVVMARRAIETVKIVVFDQNVRNAS
jgi:hypothetical protein